MLSGDVSQSVLVPAGLQASSIARLWSLMLWVSAAVFAVVLVFVVVALLRGTRNRSGHAAAVTPDRGLSRSVAAAVGITVGILVALLGASVWTSRATGSLH